MTEAWNTFADSYLKHLKRPEFFNFNADGAFGANLVHGSENQNPWAGRNNDNAKYGQLGGTQPIKQAVMGDQGGSALPGVSNLPGGKSAPQNTFSRLLTGIGSTGTKMGGKWLSDTLLDKFNHTTDPTVRAAMSDALDNMLSGKTPMSAVDQATSNFLNDVPIQSGVESAINDFGSNAATEGVSEGLGEAGGSVPVVGPLVGLGVNAATGKLQSDPWGTGGQAAGAAVGGVVGSIFPVVGTTAGAAAGSMIGKHIGSAIGKGDYGEIFAPGGGDLQHGDVGTGILKSFNPLFDKSSPIRSTLLPGISDLFGKKAAAPEEKQPDLLKETTTTPSQVNTDSASAIKKLLEENTPENSWIQDWSFWE